MKKQKGRYMINRNTYKDIKKYDHQQMEAFLSDVYKIGHKDGVASVPGVELEQVYAAIDGIKGIGPKTSAKVKEALEPLFRREDQE